MKRPLFAVMSVYNAVEQICAMAANPKDLRRSVSVMQGMIKEVSSVEQLDVLDAIARYLWVTYIQQDTQRGVSGGQKMTEALNTAAGNLHFYWSMSVHRRIEIQPDSVRNTLISGIEPILKDESLSGTWFRVCFMSKAYFWLWGVDEEWAYPLLMDILSPTNPDYEGCWVGILCDNGHTIINDARFRSMLYQNFKRLLVLPDLEGGHLGNRDDLLLRTVCALFRETDDTNKSFVEDFARCGELALLEKFSEIIYRELSKVNVSHIWQAWLETYLRLRCDSPAGDEVFYLLGILMYSPNESAALKLIDSLDLGGGIDFNSSDTVILYSLLKNLHKGVTSGRISTDIENTVLSRLKKVVPSDLWSMIPEYQA